MVKRSTILCALLAVTLTACGGPFQIKPDSPAVAVTTQEVNIPIPMECKVPPAREYPLHLAIQDLTQSSTDHDTAVAYDDSIQKLTAEVMWYHNTLYGTTKSDNQGK